LQPKLAGLNVCPWQASRFDTSLIAEPWTSLVHPWEDNVLDYQ
jgi:hypothetical protein